MNETIKSILNRRSIRNFQKTQVSENELNEILQAAQYAPSGMNSQSWHFTVVQNKEKLLELNELVKTANDRLITDEGRALGECISEDYHFCYNAPTLIITSNDFENSNGPADCACAMENIFLAAHSLNIGSCWINQLSHFHDEEDFKVLFNELGIPQEHRVYGAAAIGYKCEEAPAASERQENTITFYR